MRLTLAVLYTCRLGKQPEHHEEANGVPAMNGHAAPDKAREGHVAGVAASADAAAEQPKQSAVETEQAAQADTNSAPANDVSRSAAADAKVTAELPRPKDKNGKEQRHSKERDKGDRRGSRERDGKRSRDGKDGKSSRGDRTRDRDRDRKGDDRRGDGKRSGSREKERKGDGKADRDRKSDKDRRRSRSRSVKRRRSRSVSPAARRPGAGGNGPFGIDRRVPPGATPSASLWAASLHACIPDGINSHLQCSNVCYITVETRTSWLQVEVGVASVQYCSDRSSVRHQPVLTVLITDLTRRRHARPGPRHGHGAVAAAAGARHGLGRWRQARPAVPWRPRASVGRHGPRADGLSRWPRG